MARISRRRLARDRLRWSCQGENRKKWGLAPAKQSSKEQRKQVFLFIYLFIYLFMFFVPYYVDSTVSWFLLGMTVEMIILIWSPLQSR